MTRGDVVIVDFRPSNPHAGVRPALVIQNDRDNARMGNTIVVQITTNVSRSHLDTQLLIEPQHPDWSRSGLRQTSVVNASNIYTVEQADIARVIGSLSLVMMQQIDRCSQIAMGLPTP